MKTFYEIYMGGKNKYTVNFHDGKSTHKDGSKFYDMRIFKNKKKVAAFIKELKEAGYTPRVFC